MINVSSGKSQSIEIVAKATAEGLKDIASALQLPKGRTAMSVKLAEQYVTQFGEILKGAETTVLPSDIANLKGLVDTILPALSSSSKGGTV